MYRKIKVSVGVVPMLLAENRIPNTFCPQGIIFGKFFDFEQNVYSWTNSYCSGKYMPNISSVKL
jgi:hypothetical protein